MSHNPQHIVNSFMEKSLCKSVIFLSTGVFEHTYTRVLTHTHTSLILGNAHLTE